MSTLLIWRPVLIEPFAGERSDLLELYRAADDSDSSISSYIDAGDVMVARRGHMILGHVQLVWSYVVCEIKSVAVREGERRRGIGSALVQAAIDHAFTSGAACVRVATAAADIRNLGFYQRIGFRLDWIERDVFTVDRGYPAVTAEGIPLRDRVWFSMEPDERLFEPVLPSR